MNAKVFIYIIVSILVVWSMDSININQIFKKNRIYQARIFYLLLALAIIYLITNFIYDFFFSTQTI